MNSKLLKTATLAFALTEVSLAKELPESTPLDDVDKE